MAIQENKALLKRVPLFEVLSDAELDQLSSVVVKRAFPKNRSIVTEGEATQWLYILLSGHAKVQVCDEEGREVILAILEPGEFFGEMGLIDEAPRSASVITIEPCEFLAIAKEDFKRCMRENFEMSLLIMRGLVRRLREADKKIETLALLDVYGRVARALLEMSDDVDGKRVIKKMLPRQEVAKMIGASREMVSRVMKEFEVSGMVIENPDGSVTLRDNITATRF